MWDESYYNDDRKDQNNPLRCIMRKESKRQTYFQHMSEAMAYFCDVFATVMSDDPKDVPLTGRWGRVEFPRLKQSGNEGTVDEILAINDGGSKDVVYCKRPDTRKREDANTDSQDYASLMKRETCGAPEGVESVFDKGGDLQVEW